MFRFWKIEVFITSKYIAAASPSYRFFFLLTFIQLLLIIIMLNCIFNLRMVRSASHYYYRYQDHRYYSMVILKWKQLPPPAKQQQQPKRYYFGGSSCVATATTTTASMTTEAIAAAFVNCIESKKNCIASSIKTNPIQTNMSNSLNGAGAYNTNNNNNNNNNQNNHNKNNNKIGYPNKSKYQPKKINQINPEIQLSMNTEIKNENDQKQQQLIVSSLNKFLSDVNDDEKHKHLNNIDKINNNNIDEIKSAINNQLVTTNDNKNTSQTINTQLSSLLLLSLILKNKITFNHCFNLFFSTKNDFKVADLSSCLNKNRLLTVNYQNAIYFNNEKLFKFINDTIPESFRNQSTLTSAVCILKLINGKFIFYFLK